MGPEGSLPFSQEPASGSYPEPDASTPHLPILFKFKGSKSFLTSGLQIKLCHDSLVSIVTMLWAG
jgi:hypothetical protein